MIKFHNLTIRNFLSVANATVTLGDEGLVLIEGVNKDDPSARSNGAGKSSVVDALSWCLYGRTARGASGDAVVNVAMGKGTVVDLNVEIDGVAYTVTRCRKHPKYKNRLMLYRWDEAAGKSEDLTLGTDKLTQERIVSLMGCTAEVFNASIYMGQESMADLPGMTDKELKAILESSLGLDQLDMALEMVKDQLAAFKGEAGSYQEQMRGAKHGKEVAQATLDVLETQLADLIEQQDGHIADYSITMSELKDTWTDAQNKIKGVTRGDTKAIEDEMESIRAKVTTKIRSLQAATTAYTDALLEALTAKQKEYDQERHELNSLMSGVCGTCKRPHDGAAVSEEEVEVVRARMKVLGAEISEIKTQRDARRTKLAEDITTVERKETEAVAKLRTRHRAVIKDMEIIDKCEDAIRQSEREMAVLEKRLATDTIGMNRRMDQCKALIVARNKEIDEAREEIDAAIHKLEAVEDKAFTCERLAHAFSRKGFRGEVLDQVTPYLNSRTAHYLSALSDGNIEAVWSTLKQNALGEWTENFRIDVEHKSGVGAFANLSGGEKRKVRLATALALQDLVATRAIKPIKLFVADEIDDALDESGLELLMGVLEQKARDMGTVLIISHNELADWCRNIITVTKEHGKSTLIQRTV